MKLSEFFSQLSAANQKILSGINANLMGSLWTTGQTGFQSILDGMSQDIILYHAEKDLNPVIESWMEFNNITDLSTISSTNYSALIKFLFAKYQDKWTRLWNYVYKQDYNPIWNVDGEETLETWTDYGKKTTNTKDWSDTSTITDDINESDVYGFDSASPVGDSKSTRNGEAEVVHDGTDSYEDSGRDHYKEVKTRGGNIGITMTTQLLESELVFREKFNYFEIVMMDVLSELAINIY